MTNIKLTSGGSGFKMSVLKKDFSRLIRYGDFNNLKNNKNQALNIFEELSPIIRREGKLSFSTRRRAVTKFASLPGTTRDDERDFKKILDNYK